MRISDWSSDVCSSDLSWKGIDLALDFQGVHGVFVQYNELLVEALPFGGQHTLDFFMDRWHTADPSADYFHPNTKWVPGHSPVTGPNGHRAGTKGDQKDRTSVEKGKSGSLSEDFDGRRRIQKTTCTK